MIEKKTNNYKEAVKNSFNFKNVNITKILHKVNFLLSSSKFDLLKVFV
jgi:hypothetical protein